MASSSQKDLFTEVISEIKNYTGDDPLRPWVRGIRKIHQSLPLNVLNEKLPRFLQKCAQTFESDHQYRNDSRYLAVWIHLMDFVEDARVVLRKMEKNKIGVKRTKFYTAYALYYEKKKRFVDAEKMYLLGVQKLAEPMEELQKSYDEFLNRMKLRKQRRARVEAVTEETGKTNGHSQNTTFDDQNNTHNADYVEEDSFYTLGKSSAQPQSITINTVDNSAPFYREDVRSKVDKETMSMKSFACSFKILGDDEDVEDDDACGHSMAMEEKMEGYPQHNSPTNPNSSTKDQITSFDIRINEDTVIRRLKEDTVIRKFVCSTVFDEPKFEHACHHGLVDPTVNHKQAMDDINSMFGKPLNFTRAGKTKKEDRPFDRKQDHAKPAFFILADDCIEKNLNVEVQPPISCSSKNEIDLFEPTLFTKEALNEINDLFERPLDF